MRYFQTLASLLFVTSIIALPPSEAEAQNRSWDVSAGTVILNRDASYDNGFIEDGVGNVLIGDAQFESGVEAGFNVEGNLNLNSTTGINTRFFFVDDWSENATAISGGGLFVSQSAVAGNLLYDNAFSSYSSDLYSAEVSLARQQNDWLRILGGFRWLQINEASHTDFFTGVVDSADYDGSLENNLYGGQLGIDALLIDKQRVRFNSMLKAGVYGANLQTTGLFQNGITAPLSASDSDVAFVGEVNLNCNVRLTNNISASGGWMFLWVDGIGVLSEQYDDVNWATGAGSDIDGHAFYQGAVLNLTILLP